MGPLRSPGTLLVATLAACGPIAYAATYTVTDLGTLGGNRSSAAAINARGDVVGWSTLAGDSAIHAFLYQSRHPRMIDVDPRGATVSSEALAINDRGCIAGDIAVGGGALHPALFVRGRTIDLGTPMGLPSASAVAINHAGDVLIQVQVGSAFSEGFLLHHGQTVALPIQSAFGLNDRRQAVGSVSSGLAAGRRGRWEYRDQSCGGVGHPVHGRHGHQRARRCRGRLPGDWWLDRGARSSNATASSRTWARCREGDLPSRSHSTHTTRWSGTCSTSVQESASTRSSTRAGTRE